MSSEGDDDAIVQSAESKDASQSSGEWLGVSSESLDRVIPMEKLRNGWNNACDFFNWGAAKSKEVADSAAPTLEALNEKVHAKIKAGYEAAVDMYEKGTCSVPAPRAKDEDEDADDAEGEAA